MRGGVSVKKLLCGLLCLSMVCTVGCSAMLDRDYSFVTEHSATPASDGDTNTLRVKSYQELVNALIYLINKGSEEGTIRFEEGEEADVKQMMDEACLEVQEDPLGAYAVDYIKYGVTSIVGSYEAGVSITYRRTREQVAAIVDATGTSAIRSELSRALATFSDEVVLRISYFEENEAYIQELVRQAYLSNPETALGMPQAQVAMYPKSGQQRIVEVLLTYPQSLQVLESQRNSMAREAERLVLPLQDLSVERKLSGIVQALSDAGGYVSGGGSTPYDALFNGGADSQGIALAMALLCRQAGISCVVVDGQWKGQSHCWNVVQTDQGYRHVDLTSTAGVSYQVDTAMAQLGYTWDSELVPKCTVEG